MRTTIVAYTSGEAAKVKWAGLVEKCHEPSLATRPSLILEARCIGDTIRLPANKSCRTRSDIGSSARSVERRTRCVATAQPGYQAQNWSKLRRVVAKFEWHPGELYPRASS